MTVRGRGQNEAVCLRGFGSGVFCGSERGSLLVFFSFLIILIFVAVAFAIDITRLVSAAQEKQNTARFIALSMMERYSEVVQAAAVPFSPKIQQEAFDAALQRAIDIGRENSLTSRFLEQHLSSRADLVGPNRNLPGKRGQIESGRWFDSAPKHLDCSQFKGIDPVEPKNRCPCGGVPCFVGCINEQGCQSLFSNAPGSDRAPEYEPANAFRVTLGTSDEKGGGVRLLFAQVFGHIEQAVERKATAVLLPRHFVVLQDLSRAAASDSHLFWQKTGPVTSRSGDRQPSEFAFRCDGRVTSSTPASCNVRLDQNEERPPFRSGKEPRSDTTPQKVWDLLADEPCAPGEPVSRQCYTGFDTPEGSFLVDRRVLAGFGEGDVPQPYTAMRKSANQLLRLMAQEHQGGDRVSLLGFGRDTGAKRTYALAQPRESDETFQKMLRLTSSKEEDLREQVANLFFPGADGYFSDLPMGLLRAEEVLKIDPFYETTQKHVFLVTGGITTCQRLTPDEKRAPEGVPTCSELYSDHVRSWQEVFQRHLSGRVPGTYEGEGISLHVVHVGAVTAPYTIAIRMPGEDRCMKPDEMRSFGFSPTLPQPVDRIVLSYEGIGGGKTEPYLDAGRWLSAAAGLTGGMYLPIRIDQSRCGSISSTSCPPDSARGFHSAIDKACAAHRGPLPGQSKSELVNVTGRDFFNAPGEKVPPQAYDDEGRIFCDPMCREQRGTYPLQIEADMTRFLRRSPLSLVEEGAK